MKRLLLSLLLLATGAHAVTLLTGGNINQWPVSHRSDNNQLVIQTQNVNADGTTTTATTTTISAGQASTTYMAVNTLAVHSNTEDFLGSLSPTATDAFKYLTPSALTTVTVSNIGTGAGTVWMAFSNTSAAVNPTNIGIACVPGICVFTNPPGTFMHYANANVLTITAAVHDWLTPALSGTTLPQTPPFN